MAQIKGIPALDVFKDTKAFEIHASKVVETVVFHHLICPVCNEVLAIGIDVKDIQGDIKMLMGVTDLLIRAQGVHLNSHRAQLEAENHDLFKKMIDVIENLSVVLEDGGIGGI